MSTRWYDKVQDSLNALARAGLKSFLASDSQPLGPEHNSSAAPSNPALSARHTRSNASSKNSHRAQMPSDSNPPKYRTRTVSHLLDRLDRPEAPVNGPVHIDLASDDEDEARDSDHKATNSAARGQDPIHRTSTTGLQARQSEWRSGTRLEGGLSRRSPRITVPEDPVTMNRRKTPFKGPSPVYQHVDRLNRSNGTRSTYIQERTNNRRVTVHVPSKQPAKPDIRPNDHATPNKRRKTGDSREFGDSAASAISLDDSQTSPPPNDSEDELALGSSKPANRNSTGAVQQSNTSHQFPQTSTSMLRSRNDSSIIPVHGKSSDSSSTDEGDFTRGAARQRRAEKDGMLHSSPDQLDQTTTSHKSPYFGLAVPSTKLDDHASNYPCHKAPIPDSPDALQGGVTRPGQEPNGKSYGSMRSTALGALITGNDSSTTITKPSKSHAKNALSHRTRFNLTEVVSTKLSNALLYTITIDTTSEEISFHTAKPMLPDEPLLEPYETRRIVKVLYGADQSSLILIQLRGVGEDKMLLRFESPKTSYDFVTLLEKVTPSVSFSGRESIWMEDALKKYRIECVENQGRAQARAVQATEHPSAQAQAVPTSQPNSGEKRVRLVDKLDGPSPATKQRTVISGVDRMAAYQDAASTQQHAKSRVTRDTPQPETIHSTVPARRLTRSKGEQDHPSREREHSEPPVKLKFSQSGLLGQAWSQDLVYPHPGRRAAVVPFSDLARLDDDEFLNDNLILFFMRFLETHLEKNNPELYKRMHFFNTYFYEALTKTSKGKKSLNYDAVSRWTKNINLFSRDFVVVPVNENLHWYVAIICNLPYFLGDKADSGWPETAMLGDQQREESEDEADQPTTETQKSLAELSISDRDKEESMPAKKKRLGRRKSVRRSLPKYEVNKPVIITLDSLGHGRSATCTHLKNYVALEAKDKRGHDIDTSEIRGMTAKEIPTQSNFSDCGLYVCVYLEQFAADPYNFIRRILQRDEGAQKWPRRIRSEDLRSKLRDLIMEMHRRQEKESPNTDDQAIGSILIDKKEPTPTPEPVMKRQLRQQKIDDARERFEALTSTRDDESNSSHDYQLERRNPLAVAHERLDAMEAVPDSQVGHDDDEEEEGEDDLIIDEEQSGAKAILPSIPPSSGNRVSKRVAPAAPVVEVEGSSPPNQVHSSQQGRPIPHRTPAELAQYLRTERTGQDPNKRRRITEKSKSPEKARTSRSPSRLTDELLGERSYIASIEFAASQASANPDRLITRANGERPMSRDGKLVVMVPESVSSSPGLKVVDEGKSPRVNGTPPSKKRKRTPGMKIQAPETAEDLTREEFNGFEDRAEAEVPDTRQTELDQAREHGRHRKRGPRNDTEDGEMLLT